MLFEFCFWNTNFISITYIATWYFQHYTLKTLNDINGIFGELQQFCSIVLVLIKYERLSL